MRVGTSEAEIAAITTFVPFPRRYWAFVTAPASAFIAAWALVVPVPPLASARVVERPAAVPEVF